MQVKINTCGGTAIANAVKELYREGQQDYSLEPIVRVDLAGEPIGRIKDNDTVIFCCRRGEREIQLTDAFVDPVYDKFPRQLLQKLNFVILTLYHDKFKGLPVAFAPAPIQNTLGEMVSRAGLSQIRIAESEKFAHVTYFLNGGNNQPFPGEHQLRIPSPHGIPYDQVPELSLAKVANNVKESIQQNIDLIVTNFANGDVIGHTSSCPAKVRCAEVLDQHLGIVVQAAVEANYTVLITADHGNLEVMTNPDGSPHVAHTNNPVPFILIDPQVKTPANLRDGILADIAPTILSAFGITQPDEMSGQSLAPEHYWGGRRKVLLIILDGWGNGSVDNTNPIYLGNTPVWDGIRQRYPQSHLKASGDWVGLQAGKAGNSEAGHMNIGAGRIVTQDDVRLDQSLQDGTFFTNTVLCESIQQVKAHKTSLHLIGLLTEKSSHGSIDYPLALLKMAKLNGLEQVFLHLIFDGRSTQPGSAPEMLEVLEDQLGMIGVGQIATGMGRGIALDRDGNYARTQQAYQALVDGIGKKCMDH